MTQSALEEALRRASVIGPSRGYLSKMRYGDRGSKRGSGPELIEAISDICGVDFHWLSTGRGAMLPPRTPPVGAKTSPPPSRTQSR